MPLREDCSSITARRGLATTLTEPLPSPSSFAFFSLSSFSFSSFSFCCCFLRLTLTSVLPSLMFTHSADNFCNSCNMRSDLLASVIARVVTSVLRFSRVHSISWCCFTLTSSVIIAVDCNKTSVRIGKGKKSEKEEN